MSLVISSDNLVTAGNSPVPCRFKCCFGGGGSEGEGRLRATAHLSLYFTHDVHLNWNFTSVLRLSMSRSGCFH